MNQIDAEDLVHAGSEARRAVTAIGWNPESNDELFGRSIGAVGYGRNAPRRRAWCRAVQKHLEHPTNKTSPADRCHGAGLKG